MQITGINVGIKCNGELSRSKTVLKAGFTHMINIELTYCF
jgi:hypothetical protein